MIFFMVRETVCSLNSKFQYYFNINAHTHIHTYYKSLNFVTNRLLRLFVYERGRKKEKRREREKKQ